MSYIDRFYLDLYCAVYARRMQDYDRFCIRVGFFSKWIKDEYAFITSDCEVLEKSFLGSMVIYPVMDNMIGRTLLSPEYALQVPKANVRLGNYEITFVGKRLKVKAFPYATRDPSAMSCAELAVLNLVDYYSQMYPDYHRLVPSQIFSDIDRNSFERRKPETGISIEATSKVLCEEGFYPSVYYLKPSVSGANFKDNLQFRLAKETILTYLESGIPLLLGVHLIREASNHVISAVGYEKKEYNAEDLKNIPDVSTMYGLSYDANLVLKNTAYLTESLIVMDDLQQPYKDMKLSIKQSSGKSGRFGNNVINVPCFLGLENRYELKNVVVPLSPHMIIDAEKAWKAFLLILKDNTLGWKSSIIQELLQEINSKYVCYYSNNSSEGNSLYLRVFMASSRTFKQERDKAFKGNNSVRILYDGMLFPRFIWVCEIYNEKGLQNKEAIGEIILDTTVNLDLQHMNFFLIHYPGIIITQDSFSEDDENADFDVDLDDSYTSWYGFDWNPFAGFSKNLSFVEKKTKFGRKYPFFY
jgi:hypothetical protein